MKYFFSTDWAVCTGGKDGSRSGSSTRLGAFRKDLSSLFLCARAIARSSWENLRRNRVPRAGIPVGRSHSLSSPAPPSTGSHETKEPWFYRARFISVAAKVVFPESTFSLFYEEANSCNLLHFLLPLVHYNRPTLCQRDWIWCLKIIHIIYWFLNCSPTWKQHYHNYPKFHSFLHSFLLYFYISLC
jgi:hypothetical protein